MKRDSDAPVSTEELVAHLFGDADDPQAVEAALASSAELRRTFEELEQTLALVDEEAIPSRSHDYGAEVFRRLEDRLGEVDAPAPVVPFPKRHPLRAGSSWLGVAAAALLLLGAGFLLGRWGAPGPDPARPQLAGDPEAGVTAFTGQARERLLATALSRHLGETERVLAELVNASYGPLEQAGLESLWASELLASNRIYRRAAEEAGQKRIARLLAEIEPVLLEMAHAGSGHSADQHAEEIGALRRRVDERGLLFKVRVTERRLGESSSFTNDSLPTRSSSI